MQSNINRPRTEFGLSRTQCDCAKCTLLCKFKPAALIPADLTRLIPPDANPFDWAEEHLRAFGGITIVTRDRTLSVAPLVPARSSQGPYHRLINDRCVVHENAPFGCAFFDQCTQSHAEAMERGKLADEAIADDWFQGGLYSQLWLHLWGSGFTECPTPADRLLLQNELRKLG